MFKFSPPTMKVILSSGSFLTLIALGCLVVMSTSVHTSDIHERANDDAIGATAASILTTSPASTSDDARAPQREAAPKGRQARQGGDGLDSRHRSGRLYQSQAQQQQQQQSPLESYAAAYAAANSGASSGAADPSALAQQSVAVGSQPSDSSFGEPAGPPSASQIARQLASSPSDYPAAHSSYFAGYMSPSSNEVSYSGAGYSSPGGNHHLHHNHHHHHQHKAHLSHHQQLPPLGYPTNAMYEQRGFGPMTSSYYDRIAHSSAASSPFWAASSLGSGGAGGGLMSSASHALSHWTNGFSIGEIICGLVAIAIGAIILGAPFFLIYLALMGNFSGSGTLSLTNPTSASGAAGGAAAPANGRRKRLAVFEAMNISEQTGNKHPDLAAIVESVANSLGPYVNLQQVSGTFKQLVRSIEKYSMGSEQSEQAQQAKPQARASKS